MNGGEDLRHIRERLGLTIRDVEAASMRLAAKYGSPSYAISLSRLSDIEAKGVVPNIYKLYSLAVIYRRDIYELLSLFGVSPANYVDDLEIAIPTPKRSHLAPLLEHVPKAEVPTQVDPGFRISATADVGRLIVRWGTVPLTVLSRFKDQKYVYGYIGTDDLTMYPLILPGSFVQVDESRTDIRTKTWRSEFERPIYFVETRQGFVCSWCELRGNVLTLIPHPLSPVASRTFRLGSEAEVIGQVVGVAMRLVWRSHESELEERGP